MPETDETTVIETAALVAPKATVEATKEGE